MPERPSDNRSRVADLLQAPLDYPQIDDYATDVLDVLAFAPARKGSSAGGKKPKRKQAPPKARSAPTKTPEMKIQKSDLSVALFVSPDTLVPVGESVTIMPIVQFTNEQGELIDWDPARVQILFRGQTVSGKGPHTFSAQDIGQYEIQLKVELWSDAKRDWKGVVVQRLLVRVFCPETVDGLDADTKLLACTIFSEGGSKREVPEKEVYAIGWTIRNRVDLLTSTDAALRAEDTKENRNKKEFAFKRFGSAATYQAVITKPEQFDGYGGEQYRICERPGELANTNTVCERVHLCIEVAKNVISGAVPDPYAGQGNPKGLGVFYFMTKSDYAMRKKKRARGEYAFIPTGPLLPGLNGNKDAHFYWGLDLDNAFKP